MSDDAPHTGDTRKRRRGRPRLDDQLVPQILDAAERLFAEHGPVSVTMRDIAAEAGLSHSAIYRYFASRDELLLRVLERGRLRQAEHEAEWREAGKTTEGALDWIFAHNRAYLMLYVRLALDGETASSIGLDARGSVARRTLGALESAPGYEVHTGLDPRMVVAAAMAMTMGYVTGEAWILDAVGVPESEREAARAALDDVMRSIIALGDWSGGAGG